MCKTHTPTFSAKLLTLSAKALVPAVGWVDSYIHCMDKSLSSRQQLTKQTTIFRTTRAWCFGSTTSVLTNAEQQAKVVFFENRKWYPHKCWDLPNTGFLPNSAFQRNCVITSPNKYVISREDQGKLLLSSLEYMHNTHCVNEMATVSGFSSQEAALQMFNKEFNRSSSN